MVGASEGLGRAFALECAARGLDVALVARRREALEQVAGEVRALGVEALLVVADLAEAGACECVMHALGEREVGLVVMNAALSPKGDFLERGSANLRAVQINVTSLTMFAEALLPAMRERGRGAFVVLSSLAGLRGTAGLATYAASKAYGRVFAEALWAELKDEGVHVLASCPGAVDTPGFRAHSAATAMASEEVAGQTLDALSLRSGPVLAGPVVVPGASNRFAERLLQRLPRRAGIWLMSRASQKTLDKSS